MLRTSMILFSSAILLAAILGAGCDTEPFPETVDGWRRAGPDGIFTADTLYELIDGAAEIYRAFNVKGVRSRRYFREDGGDIIADLFDMGSSHDAFGAYHFDMREGEAAGVGRESEIVGSSLAFWKDRYFVSITPFEDNLRIRKAVLTLGKSIAGTIAGDGPPPDLVGMLPREGLIANRIHYFHDWLIFDRLTTFNEGNIFGLSRRTEGVLSSYRLDPSPGLRPASLILVRYPSPDEARRVLEALQERLPGYGVGSSARRRGKIVAAVFEGLSRGRADSLIDAVFARLPVVNGGAD